MRALEQIELSAVVQLRCLGLKLGDLALCLAVGSGRCDRGTNHLPIFDAAIGEWCDQTGWRWAAAGKLDAGDREHIVAKIFIATDNPNMSMAGYRRAGHRSADTDSAIHGHSDDHRHLAGQLEDWAFLLIRQEWSVWRLACFPSLPEREDSAGRKSPACCRNRLRRSKTRSGRIART
jgi:hypothetical protein